MERHNSLIETWKKANRPIVRNDSLLVDMTLLAAHVGIGTALVIFALDAPEIVDEGTPKLIDQRLRETS